MAITLTARTVREARRTARRAQRAQLRYWVARPARAVSPYSRAARYAQEFPPARHSAWAWLNGAAARAMLAAR